MGIKRGFCKQKTQVAKKKKQFFFFLFSLAVLHGFSPKSNEDEFSKKLNGGWIFLGIKRGLQNNNNNNNNMIRLVLARIESRREGQILSFGEQLQKRPF